MYCSPRPEESAKLACTLLRFFTPICLGAIALCAAPQATVNVDELAVHSSTSAKSAVVGSLKRGASVTVGLVLSGSEGSWCEITQSGPPPLSGFVPCGQLNREAPQQPNYSVVSPSGGGASARADTDAAIAEALRLSGTDEAIQQLGDPSIYMAATRQRQLTPQQTAELRELVMQSMRPETFRRAVIASLKSSYPADAYPQLLSLLRSPLARRMTAIEVRESRADPKAIQTFAAGLGQNPPSAQRQAIIRHLDQATRTSERTVDIVVAVMEGIAAGSRDLPPQQSRKIIDDFRAQRGDTVRQAAIVKLLYQYRNVPDDQLNDYATLLASPPAVRFNEAATTGLLEATRQASAEFMRALMQRFPVKPPAP